VFLKPLKLTIFLLFATILVRGQSISHFTIVTAGMDASAESYSVNASLGQVVSGTRSVPFFDLTEGFQQPLTRVRVPEPGDPFNSFQVYPNPIKDNLYIRFYVDNINDYTIQLFDINGRKTFDTRVSEIGHGQEFYISIGNLPRGLYLLKVRSIDGSLSKNYKIKKQ
jgi:hypothetical protein